MELGIRKLESWGYQMVKKSWPFDTTLVCDRRTDRRTDTLLLQRPALGKNHMTKAWELGSLKFSRSFKLLADSVLQCTFCVGPVASNRRFGDKSSPSKSRVSIILEFIKYIKKIIQTFASGVKGEISQFAKSMIRYDTIEEFNVDSKAEYTA